MTAMLYDHQNMLLEETIRLRKFYQENLSYYKELTLYIMAGKEKLEKAPGGQMRENFEKKLHDLELTRMVSVQMGPQTRLLQTKSLFVLEFRCLNNVEIQLAYSLV